MKDPTAYYDPTTYDKAVKSATIVETIENMKKEMKTMNTGGPVFTEENFPVKTKIQNIKNASREDTNNMIADSYYFK